MHLLKFLSSTLLAGIAATSPLASGKTSLERRATSDGQAGANIDAAKGIELTFVQGTVVMPNLDKATKDQQVSYWVGIDGKDADGNQKQIVVQAGFDATKKEDGSTSIEAWWEWFPNPLTMIPAKDFSASPGDTVTIAVTTKAYGTMADANFINQSTGKSFTKEFYTPDEDYDAKGANAQWVIERAPGTTLANFGELKFTECSAATSKGTTFDLSGGETIEFVDQGTTKATAEIKGGSEVVIKYTGS